MLCFPSRIFARNYIIVIGFVLLYVVGRKMWFHFLIIVIEIVIVVLYLIVWHFNMYLLSLYVENTKRFSTLKEYFKLWASLPILEAHTKHKVVLEY